MKTTAVWMLSAALVLSAAPAALAETMNVAIFVHEGVELLDFAGPGEVFEIATYFTDLVDFEVFTVGPDSAPVRSQRFLDLTPNFDLENHPLIDILVLPGGATDIPAEDPKVIAWIQDQADRTRHILSVCSGVFLLTKAGLLDDLAATTHKMLIGDLRETVGTDFVHEAVKFVDNGQIITSAGVSSGIEGSLHLVRRIAGVTVARRVARYLEYDHWNARIGRVEVENPVVTEIRRSGQIDSDAILVAFDARKEKSPLFYFGEMDRLGYEYLDRQHVELAAQVFELNQMTYPETVLAYDSLAAAYRKRGKYAPPVDEDFLAFAVENGAEEAWRVYEKTMRLYPTWRLFMEPNILAAGSSALGRDQAGEAARLYELALAVYPTSAEVHNGLGAAYRELGRAEKARSAYAAALELEPDNASAKAGLESLTAEESP